MPPEELTAIAAGLGADVPFFLTGGTALCEGIGERVTPIPGVPPLTFVLAIPDVPVSTAAVFRSADLDLTSPRRGGSLIAEGLARAHVECLSAPEEDGGIFNRLTRVAFALEPELAETARRLERTSGRRFHMTGSGSGLYTFCAKGVAEGNRVMSACESTTGVRAFHLVTTLPTATEA
jgi:4-diphosphocytidyl-2-C-methyl-D-erythritol kinase